MADVEEMSCKELVELITDYVEGALPSAERARFEEHFKVCPGCQTYLAQMRTTIRALGRLTEEAIPAKTREEFLQAFRNWKRR